MNIQDNLNMLAKQFVSMSKPPPLSAYSIYTQTKLTQFNQIPDTSLPPTHTHITQHNMFTLDDIQQFCTTIPTNTAPGPDSIPAEFIKYAGTQLHICLYKLFSLSCTYGVLPTVFKRAAVCPIYKPNKDATLRTSYRPVSVTSVLIRLFERLIIRYIIHSSPIYYLHVYFIISIYVSTSTGICLLMYVMVGVELHGVLVRM